MRYRLLGKSGLRVSELCLGTMTFGNAGWGSDESEARSIYAGYRDAGGNFFDTANEIYAQGRSEEVLGRLIAGHRDELVVASKYSLALPGTRDPNWAGNHRKSLRRSVEASLRRLDTDYLDMLWVHAWDTVTPVEETMRALDDLVRQGKVLYLGISNAPAWVVAKCNMQAQAMGQTAFVALQVEYNLIERSIEQELLPMARDFGMSIAAWSPLAGGLLSGKYGNPQRQADGQRLDSAGLGGVDEHGLKVAQAVMDVASRLGHSPSQVALNWLRACPGVIPLIGARTRAQLDDNLGCLSFELDEASLAELARVSESELRYPQRYLQKYRELLFAGFAQQVDSRG
ncbi:aldo/keto reductase [Aquipseudomonas ullengensis]|uniref:Aldo/keto reductase n=1 Tax=Aquipseudomonas ullengensis TaxID=2759166 RepID=A0A7W4LQ95_9GAMM|nr:aldo/keto reductase [Pseudomonas ullengensis]MBB2497336.1 aldo/keto reductase [Pseudomonas ullengensis]